MKAWSKFFTVGLLLLIVFALPVSAEQTQNQSITAMLQPGRIIIAVKDTSIAMNSTMVYDTIPKTVAGIFIKTGANDSYVDTVQKFIDKFRKEYPNKLVFQYFFYYKSNDTTIESHIYSNVSYYVVSPLSKKELDEYLKLLAGKKVFVVENYMVTTYKDKNNQTVQNVTEMIPLDYLIQLYEEGKIAGVMFPFYQVEKDGSQVLYEKMKSDAETLQLKKIPTVGIVMPYVNFFTGTVDLPRTLGSIVLSNDAFGMTVYIDWSTMPVPMLYYLDPQMLKCSASSSGSSIDWQKVGYYLGLIPALIIIVIFVAVMAKKKSDKKENKKGKKAEEKKE